jgi:gluconate 2-dehydrogenase gamma chain
VEKEQQGKGQKGFTRRRFLKLAGIAAASASVTGALESCETTSNAGTGAIPSTGNAFQQRTENFPEVPLTPTAIPDMSKLMFFTPEEARMVDAIASRLIPGDAQDPGAHEAEVVIYIDRKLAWSQNNGFAEPTYFKPPFAKLYEGDTPPGPNDAKTVYIKKSEIDRYGFQGSMPPQETYRKALPMVDKASQNKFGQKFLDLSSDQQDQLLEDMENGKTTGFSEPPDSVFFSVIHDDAIEGMFADPVYGGNRDMVGWKLIGYPGAQRAYTPVDLHDEKHLRPPQNLLMLHDFHPGQPANSDVIVPPSGSEPGSSPQQ